MKVAIFNNPLPIKILGQVSNKCPFDKKGGWLRQMSREQAWEVRLF